MLSLAACKRRGECNEEFQIYTYHGTTNTMCHAYYCEGQAYGHLPKDAFL